MPRIAFAAAMTLLVAAALCFRLPDLGNRPFHGDEAVHAEKFRILWQEGKYAYDPNEYHGPTIYYAALPVVQARGRTDFAATREADYRLPTALVGAAILLLLPLLRDALGGGGALWAGLLFAVSPAFVFYSRYFIQEIVLAFFTVALIACAWRYRQSGRTGWAIGAGLSAGMMVATKETAPLTFVAFGLAWLAALRAGRRAEADAEPAAPRPRAVAWKTLALAAVAGVVAAYLFLSGFLSTPGGPLGYFEAYTPWLKRAGGTDLHRQPWHYYLSLLGWHHAAKAPVWSEALILGLGVVGMAGSFRRGEGPDRGADPRFTRFLTVFTLALTAIYSLIPYKTPWLTLNFLLGFILLAGIGADAIVRALRPVPLKALAALLLLAGCAQLGWQACRTAFQYHSDPVNPYVYAQPIRSGNEGESDIFALEKRVNELVKYNPQVKEMVLKVFWVDLYHWPIPWYTRRIPHQGYWVGELPEDVNAHVVIASPEFDEPLTKRLDPTHLMTGYFAVRPGVLAMVWVKMDVWEKYIMNRPKPKEDE
jgi:uncharacterized protein (TIGR03663 family)